MALVNEVEVKNYVFEKELKEKSLIRVRLNDLKKMENGDYCILLTYGGQFHTTLLDLVRELQKMSNNPGRWGDVDFQPFNQYFPDDDGGRMLHGEPLNNAFRFELFNLVLEGEGSSYIEAGLRPTGPKGKEFGKLLKNPKVAVEFNLLALVDDVSWEEDAKEPKAFLKSIVRWNAKVKSIDK